MQVRLDLQPAAAEQRLALSLCFKGSGQQVRYRLKVRSSGTAGTGQTTQSGSLTAGESEQCPLRNRLGIAADTAVEAELQWWIDDQEQPPLLERYPPRGGGWGRRARSGPAATARLKVATDQWQPMGHPFSAGSGKVQSGFSDTRSG